MRPPKLMQEGPILDPSWTLPLEISRAAYQTGRSIGHITREVPAWAIVATNRCTETASLQDSFKPPGRNSRNTLTPARAAIAYPNDTAPSPAEFALRGCHAREMNAPAAPPPMAA